MRTPLPASCFGRYVMLSSWDAAWIVASPILALYLRNGELVPHSGWDVVGVYWLISASFSLLAIFAFRIPDAMMRYFTVHDAFDIYKAAALAELVTCVVLFTFTRLDGIPRSMPLIHGMLLATGLAAARLLFVHFNDDVEDSEHHLGTGRIVLIGANRAASFFIKLLNAYPPERQRVIAVLDERPEMTGRVISGVRIIGTPDRLAATIDEFAIHGVEVEKVVVAGENILSHAALVEIQRICSARLVELCSLPQMLGVGASGSKEVEASTLRHKKAKPTPALPAYFVLKRWIDIIGSATLIVLLSPLLLAGSILTLLDVGSPMLFWQERVGRNGRSFLIYKFRTLHAPFDQRGNAVPERRRLSAIGRFLRATHIDELPQLLNVLIGDMSLIGPRPLLPEDQPQDANVRLLVRPGITGWAQVQGGKLVTTEEKQKLDEWYVGNASLWVDLYILLMTTIIAVRNSGMSEETLADVEQVHTRNDPGRRGHAGRRDAVVRPSPVNVIRLPEQRSGAPRLSSHEG